jgi:prepilin-type N-terminal cleavage/methylation domain-containing protein
MRHHHHRQHSRERGFTLMELMIVIAIIGILVGATAIAYRSILIAGNENATIQTLDNIRKAEESYKLGNRGEYGTFDQMIKAGALDKRFAGDSPVIAGYVYKINVTPKSASQPSYYTLNADPQVSEGINPTGKQHFYIDPNVSTIRTNNEQPATADDQPIGQ